MTWFKKDEEVMWCEPEFEKLISYTSIA